MSTVDEYIAALPDAQRQVADQILPLIEQTLPGQGAVWHGHPVWSAGGAPGKSPVCFVKSYLAHLTFGFWRGQAIADPSGRLTAGSRDMASVKLRSLADVDTDLFATWLRAANGLEA